MAVNLKNRDFLSLKDFSPDEIRFLLRLAADLKSAKYGGYEQPLLKGKEIALIFEKSSTRTRVGFEVAAYDQGAHVTYLGPSGTQIGHKESIRDTARVLSRIYDGIEYRGFGQEVVEELAVYSDVPVWNGLTDEFHPTQILADFLTMREFTHKHMSDIHFAFIGDTRSNMARSLMIGAAKIGMNVRLVGPRSLWPDDESVAYCRELCRDTQGEVTITDDVEEGVRGCDYLYTDVWVSMGESDSVWEERIELLKPYQVTSEVMAMTGNRHAKFMHCLPAFHDTSTKIGKEIHEKFGLEAMEVTDEVFESDASVVWDQAENRLHTIKAVLVATIGT
ncbi:MAG: ornithine carbamoyltransferase [Gammaproteobacteria bacterium]|nr:ornithine carbamoyltransferase [Gammaproteobacteria bacterium]